LIVRSHGDALLLITQPDHAALAATMMAAWCGGGFLSSPRRDVVLLAVREHDNGWREEDVSPLLDPVTGRPVDFVNAPDELRWRIWPRGVLALSNSPYAAALVAHHALQIHDASRSQPGWAAFFSTMEDLRARHLAASPFDAGDLADDYLFVRMGDLMSLTFCTGWEGPIEQCGYELRLEGTRLLVHPDPFGGHEVPCTVQARRLENRRFAGPEDASAAFAGASLETLTVLTAGA
jgi:hypothetical protein